MRVLAGEGVEALRRGASAPPRSRGSIGSRSCRAASSFATNGVAAAPRRRALHVEPVPVERHLDEAAELLALRRCRRSRTTARNSRSKLAPTVARSALVRELGADVRTGAGDVETSGRRDATRRRPATSVVCGAQRDSAASPPASWNVELVRALVEVGQPDAVLGAGRRRRSLKRVRELVRSAVDPAAGQEQCPGDRSRPRSFS